MEAKELQSHSPITDQKMLQEMRNRMALMLSIIPGLGQVYKGYSIMGWMTMILGVPLILWSTALLFLATFGLGLLLIPFCWALLGLHAYVAEDHRLYHIGIL